MKGGMITSINELDLNDITFEKMHWEYGTLMSRSVGKRSEKQTYYTKGVKTPMGEIEESVWYELAEFMVQREHEEAPLRASPKRWNPNGNGIPP